MTTPAPTLANWRTEPQSQQSFHAVETLIPAARVPAGAATWVLAANPRPVDDIPFADHTGAPRRIGEALAATDTRALVALKDGRIVAEQYGLRYDGNAPHILFSISKSVSATLAGVLAGQGLLDPDAPVTHYVPEVAGSAFGDARLRHVLDMAVSMVFDESYLNADGDYARYRMATLWNPASAGTDPGDLYGFIASIPRGDEPHGHRFGYRSPASDLLGWVIERAGGDSYAALLSRLIWQPMGAEADALVTVDAKGAARAAGGVCVRARDLARFGEMLRMGGRGIVPAGWIADIRAGGDRAAWQRGDLTYLFPDGSYRSKFYLAGGGSAAFVAIGIHGQWLWIDPDRAVVIAKLSAQSEPASDPKDLMTIAALRALAAVL